MRVYELKYASAKLNYVRELLSENTHVEQQNAAQVLSAKRPCSYVPHMKHQKPGMACSVGLKRQAGGTICQHSCMGNKKCA